MVFDKGEGGGGGDVRYDWRPYEPLYSSNVIWLEHVVSTRANSNISSHHEWHE